MGKATNAIKEFIEGIPDSKLTDLADPNPTYTLYRNVDLRLDVQNKTSGDPSFFNVQVQINSGTQISTLKNMAKKTGKRGTTVAKVLIPCDGSWDAATARQALLDSISV